MTPIRRRNPLGELLAGRIAARRLAVEAERRIATRHGSADRTDNDSHAPHPDGRPATAADPHGG